MVGSKTRLPTVPIDRILSVKMCGHCCLAGSPETAPRILIFSIAMGAEYSFYVKTIETHARAFLTLNILAMGRVLINIIIV